MEWLNREELITLAMGGGLAALILIARITVIKAVNSFFNKRVDSVTKNTINIAKHVQDEINSHVALAEILYEDYEIKLASDIIDDNQRARFTAQKEKINNLIESGVGTTTELAFEIESLSTKKVVTKSKTKSLAEAVSYDKK